ncbi:MAG TPA: tryptophan 2,3-dioxygenase family protein [Candidatus Polarisedimenticolaceae bacterium]|nr:tryptophan 2,3-dioxygenase family protein [Candidatus Polarisedimenticolaceae bacterium]
MPELTYASYLHIERLLDLQEPRSTPAEHDEMLFIVIHQVFELWFKEMLHEIEKAKADFSAGDTFGAIHTFKRLRTIMKTLVGQLDILETMTPMSFSAFRDRLDTASGFQSFQFRELEFVLGLKRPEMLRFAASPHARALLEARLQAPSLIDHFYEFLERHGVAIPSSQRGNDAHPPSLEIQSGLLHLYKTRPELAILFESMTDLDEGFQEWKYRHVKLVERTIGNKKGTGGSLGVEFLKQSLFRPVFPDLWAIRHEL